MSHWLENPMAAQQGLLREQLPVLWESYRSERYELIEDALRRIFSFIQAIHLAHRKDAETVYLEAHKRWKQWQKLEAGLGDAFPEYCRIVKANLPELETALNSVTDTGIKATLSFCMGGLKRLSSLTHTTEPRTEPQGFPRGLAWDQVGPEAVQKAVSGLSNPGGTIESPAQLLGRLESIAMNWWYSHLQLSELYGKSVSETQMLGGLIQKRFHSAVEEYLIPVLDTLDTAIDNVSANATFSAFANPLRELQQRTHGLLSHAGIQLLSVELGDPFDRATQHAVRPVTVSKREDWIVSKVLRRGYRTEIGILRFTDVELVRS